MQLNGACAAMSALRRNLSNAPPVLETAALAQDLLGVALMTGGKYTESRVHLQAAIDTFRELADQWPEQHSYQQRIAVGTSHLATLEVLQQDFTQADQTFAAACDRMVSAVAESPEDPALLQAAAAIASRWSDLSFMQRKSSEGQSHWQLADRHWKQLASQSRDARHLAAAAWQYAAGLEAECRDPARAQSYARSALELAPQNQRYRVILRSPCCDPENRRNASQN